MLPEIEAMGLHVCQSMIYDWIVLDLADMDVSSKDVLDFGPNGYPLLGLLASMGAYGAWHDRDEGVGAKMRAVAQRYGVGLEELQAIGSRTFDVVIASNAIQHNRDVASVYKRLANSLTVGGRLYVAESVTDGPAVWDAARADPCWHRPLSQIHAAWTAAGLQPVREAFFRYRFAPDRRRETGDWCSAALANRVVARLVSAGGAS